VTYWRRVTEAPERIEPVGQSALVPADVLDLDSSIELLVKDRARDCRVLAVESPTDAACTKRRCRRSEQDTVDPGGTKN